MNLDRVMVNLKCFEQSLMNSISFCVCCGKPTAMVFNGCEVEVPFCLTCAIKKNYCLKDIENICGEYVKHKVGLESNIIGVYGGDGREVDSINIKFSDWEDFNLTFTESTTKKQFAEKLKNVYEQILSFGGERK